MVELLEGKALPVVQGNDDLSRIDHLLCDLVAKIREYYRRLTTTEDERRSLQLLLLQERINPHLLYNTLSSIKWAFPDERLRSVIDAMVNYYRTTLKRGNEMLTVAQEIELIRQYLILQRFAYRSDFSFVVEIDATVRDIMIPKHLLQPFVENAFLHGINGLDKGGCITVRAMRASQAIVFEIVDNGVGMPQEKADALIRNGLPGTAAGYGIRNTRRRLELAYGLASLVSIRSAVNSGTTVTISIPTV
jgi:sensor histidine kinase YesM